MLRINVKRAAYLLEMSELTVRCGIETGTLPIGSFIRKPGSKRTLYHICTHKLADYLGLTVEEVIGDPKKISNTTETGSGI